MVDKDFMNDLENIDDYTEKVDFSGKDKKNVIAVNNSFKEETPGSDYDYIDNVAEFNTSFKGYRNSDYSNNQIQINTPFHDNELSKGRLSAVSGFSKNKLISQAINIKEVLENVSDEDKTNSGMSTKNKGEKNYNSPRFLQTFGKDEVCN